MDGSGTVLPAVRLPTVPVGDGDNDDALVREVPAVELPSSDKFGFAWPAEYSPSASALHAAPAMDLKLDSPEFDSSEPESLISQDSTLPISEPDASDQTPTNEVPNMQNTSTGSNLTPPIMPRLSRAFSVPLASQLGHLKNPHRTGILSASPLTSSFTTPSSSNSFRFHELSLELADSVQMVIQTLLQISPPHLLDPAKEQFSACSLSIPSPSVSAVLTAMKNLNYMSANMKNLGEIYQESLDPDVGPSPIQDDFDIGEMLQSTGDALSGLAAQAGVDLVLFHADVGMKHVSVRGDECGLSYAVSHVVHQVINTAQRGDTIEIGLFISADSSKPKDGSDASDIRLSTSSPAPDFEGPLRCTFDIAHKFAPDTIPAAEETPTPTPMDARPKPRLNSQILQNILRRMNATLGTDLPPRLFTHGRACEITVTVQPGSPTVLTPKQLPPEEEALGQPFANANVQLASEPSLEELMNFVETLKGKKVVLHASDKGSFAHHLTSYLTAWGLDVSHVSNMLPEEPEATPPTNSTSTPTSGLDLGFNTLTTSSPQIMDQADQAENPLGTVKAIVGGSPAFIIIDDDVAALRQRLLQLQTQTLYNLQIQPRKRPSLAANHRPRSTSHIVRARGTNAPAIPPPDAPPVIVHFTSLANFKPVRDVIQSVLSSTTNLASVLPEVIVLPKPAGPRRFLTALRTAVIKPIVDPFFSPTATSPLSPSVHGLGSLSPFFSSNSPFRKPARPSPSPRTNSDRSSKSSKDPVGEAVSFPLPSPLGKSDSMEYFSEAAMKMGTSPSSGLVIQSPDGSPAGIFFHPRGAVPKAQKMDDGGRKGISSGVPSMLRDEGNLKPSDFRRGNVRRATGAEPATPDKGQTSAPSVHPSTLNQPRKTYAVREAVVGTLRDGPTLTQGLAVKGIARLSLSPRADGKEMSSALPSAAAAPGHLGSPDASGSSTAAFQRAIAGKSGPNDILNRKPPSPGSSHSPRASGPVSPVAAKRPAARRATETSSRFFAGNKKSRAATESNIVPPINVLIVEDNPINQTILSTFMKKKRIKYDVAKNGEEAVAKWKTGEYHLILMDIQMPVMDGIEATKQIRWLEKHQDGFPTTPLSEGQHTPSSEGVSVDSRASSTVVSTPFRSSVIIVALTASSLQSDRVAALAAGCNDFLTKPVSLLWLNNKIIEWGSIKALQMWADLRPEVVKSLTNGPAAQARNVANRLHMPEGRRGSPGNRSRSESLSKASTSTLTASNVAQGEEVLKDSEAASSPPKVVTSVYETPPLEGVINFPMAKPDGPIPILPAGRESSPGGLEEDERSSNAHSADLERDSHQDTDSDVYSGDDTHLGALRRTLPRIISGDEALDVRIKDVQMETTQSASGPVQRTLSSGTAVPSGDDPDVDTPRPTLPCVISGEEALESHIRDVQMEAMQAAAGPNPVLLGQRTLCSDNASIAEILHPDPDPDESVPPPVEGDNPRTEIPV